MAHTYESTHPWINFEFDLSRYPYITWLLLGRVQAKCRYIATAPFLPELGETLRRIYMAKGIHATTAIEGNTLSEDQVRRYLEGDLRLPPSQEYLGQEVENVEQLIREVLHRHQQPYSVDRIKHYNAALLRGLSLEDEVIAGEIRRHSVTVGRYRGAPAEDCEYLLGKLCDWLNTPLNAPADYRVAFGIWQAIVAHVYFAWIHPFGDGNGRTARLLEFEILLGAGVPDIAAHLLSDHYNHTRSEYYRQLQNASDSNGDLWDFVAYALQGFVDGLNEQMARIQSEQLHIHWQEYIHRTFDDRAGTSAPRKRHLLLDLADQTAAVPKTEVRRLSPRLVEDYYGKSDKTLQRDLSELEAAGLIVIENGLVRANLDLLVAFSPPGYVTTQRTP